MAIRGAPNRWLIPITLSVAVAAVAACFLSYQLSWISRRHELLRDGAVVANEADYHGCFPPRRPVLLRLLQEPGYVQR